MNEEEFKIKNIDTKKKKKKENIQIGKEMRIKNGRIEMKESRRGEKLKG